MKSLFLAVIIYSHWCIMHRESNWRVGKPVYWGDLNAPEFSKQSQQWRYSHSSVWKIQLQRKIWHKAGVLLGKLKGGWRKFQSANGKESVILIFKSNLAEISLTGRILFWLSTLMAENRFLAPTVTAGLAGFYFNQSTEFEGITYELQLLGTEGQGSGKYGKKYNKYAFSLPFGAGAIIKAGRNFDIGLEILASSHLLIT